MFRFLLVAIFGISENFYQSHDIFLAEPLCQCEVKPATHQFGHVIIDTRIGGLLSKCIKCRGPAAQCYGGCLEVLGMNLFDIATRVFGFRHDFGKNGF